MTHSFVAGWLLTTALGCAMGPTTVVIELSSDVEVATLSVQIVVAGRPHPMATLSADGGPPQLPGTLVVQLDDVSEELSVMIDAVDVSGHAMSTSGTVRSIAHAEVRMVLVLSRATDGGGLDGGAFDLPAPPDATASDLATPADLSAPDLGAAVSPTLAEDTFQRADQTAWGLASDGQHNWQGDATNGSIFSISNQTGVIENGVSGSIFTGFLGPASPSGDEGVLVTAQISAFTSSNIGAAIRVTDTNNGYKADLDGAKVSIKRISNGTSTTLASAAFSASAGTDYKVRFRVQGTTLSAKAWAATATEPAAWSVITTDALGNTGGACGVRAQASTFKVVYKYFLCTKL